MWGCCADEHSPKGTHPRSMSDMYMGMQSHACHMHVSGGELTIACREATENIPIRPRKVLVGFDIDPRRDCTTRH